MVVYEVNALFFPVVEICEFVEVFGVLPVFSVCSPVRMSDH